MSAVGSALDAGIYFSVGDLISAPGEGLPDHLTHVPREQQSDFLCALCYVILIDQVMYSHFRPDYAAFQAMTRYPKMDRSIGWARTMMMANPYEAFGPNVLASRSINHVTTLERFELWASFVVRDLAEFFSTNQLGAATWGNVREAMLHDFDCIAGEFGGVIGYQLLRAVPFVEE
ncbi:MAG: hypothetical protein KKD41_08115 [Gammaproteobacteria bacterium]|nr:hypothetical protein [Gammaproteobacteria bacterium]